MSSHGAAPKPSIPPAVADRVNLLLTYKSKAAARGDLKAVREYDLKIKKLLLESGIVHSPSMLKIGPPEWASKLMLQEAHTRAANLAKHGVPAWFRTGYDARLRAQLWLRLSRKYRDHLKAENRAGKLPLYLPAPSYWAKTIKPSEFQERAVGQAEIEEIAAREGQDPALVGAAVTAIEAQAGELADIEQELAGEDADMEALAASLEQAGSGHLAAEEKWYDDPTKLLLAGVGALFLMSVVR